jgi:pimeloyl-ACP methyl ester carboxylesterase
VAAVTFGTPATAPAWRVKPSWYTIASEDRVIFPQIEAIMAQDINATTVIVHSSHVTMLSKPEAVFDVIMQAAHKRD